MMMREKVFNSKCFCPIVKSIAKISRFSLMSWAEKFELYLRILYKGTLNVNSAYFGLIFLCI